MQYWLYTVGFDNYFNTTIKHTMNVIIAKAFINIYKNSTKDYSFMVVNNNSTKTDDPNESYGKIKTPETFIKNN